MTKTQTPARREASVVTAVDPPASQTSTGKDVTKIGKPRSFRIGKSVAIVLMACAVRLLTGRRLLGQCASV